MKKILIVFLSVILVAAAVLPAAAAERKYSAEDLKKFTELPICTISYDGNEEQDFELYFDPDGNSLVLKSQGEVLEADEDQYTISPIKIEKETAYTISVESQSVRVNDSALIKLKEGMRHFNYDKTKFNDPPVPQSSAPENTGDTEANSEEVPASEKSAEPSDPVKQGEEPGTENPEPADPKDPGKSDASNEKKLDYRWIIIIVEAVLICLLVVLFVLAKIKQSKLELTIESLNAKLKKNTSGPQTNVQSVTQHHSPTPTGDSNAGRRGVYGGGDVVFTPSPAQGEAQPAGKGTGPVTFEHFDPEPAPNPVQPVQPPQPVVPQKTFMELQKEKLLAAYRDGVTPDGEYRFATMDAKESRMVGKAVIKFVQSESAGHFLVFTDPATKKTYLAPNPRVYSARQRKFSLPTSGFTQCIGLNGNKEDGQVADVTPSELTAYSGDRMTVSRAGYIRWQ